MNAYDFVKQYEPTIPDILMARNFDLDKIANKLIRRNPDIRKREEYKDANFLFVELTMSCDYMEAYGWMRDWEEKAIAYGLDTKDKIWGIFFLAAYDIAKDLKKTIQRELK